ncbi:unnamed protein product [Orchesella dallaii]|uniref:Uncharacterized protein n=1 Tax=Orchesella dallaii TaxID=48710 RepID=A0ABP1PUR5_9HEXA
MSSSQNLASQLRQAGLRVSAVIQQFPAARIAGQTGTVVLDDDDEVPVPETSAGDEAKLKTFLDRYCEQRVNAEKVNWVNKVKHLSKQLSFERESMARRNAKLAKKKNEGKTNPRIGELENQVAELNQNLSAKKEIVLKLQEEKNALKAQLAIKDGMINELRMNSQQRLTAPENPELEVNNNLDVPVDVDDDDVDADPPPQDEELDDEAEATEAVEVTRNTRSKRGRKAAQPAQRSNSTTTASNRKQTRTRGNKIACDRCGKEYKYPRWLELHVDACIAGASNVGEDGRRNKRNRGGNENDGENKARKQTKWSLRSAPKKKRT